MDETPNGPGDAPPPPPPAAPPPPAPSESPTPPAGGTVSDNRSIMIVLSYLWLLALIPLLVEKEDKEVQWHAKHGLVLLVAEIVLWIILFVVSFGVSAVLPVLGCVTCILPAALGLAVLAVHIMCIVKGINGERFTLPFVSDFADKF